MEEITVLGRSNLIVSTKSKRTYFTITDDKDRKFICFDPGLYNDCEVGKTLEAEITPGRTAEDTPRIGRMGAKAEAKPATEGTPKPEPKSVPQKEFRTPQNMNRADALHNATLAVVALVNQNTNQPEKHLTMPKMRAMIAKNTLFFEKLLEGEVKLTVEEMDTMLRELK